MEIVRGTLQLPGQAFLQALPSHTHTHINTISWLGQLRRGNSFFTHILKPSPSLLFHRSLSCSLSFCGDLYLCISKQSQSTPTNSISCGRPLPNFPLLYSSLSLLLLHFPWYPLSPFSSDIYFCWVFYHPEKQSRS